MTSSIYDIILVDANDNPIGTMEKMEVHRKGLLHRAFSIFIFNSTGEMLLQQRSDKKYHSPGLWTNACCSHPFPGELVEEAAVRRLKEELGFTTTLSKIFDFTYQAVFDNGLTEHEFDHVFVGVYDGNINPDPAEVSDYAYLSLEHIEEKLISEPGAYTAWFHLAFPRVKSWKNALDLDKEDF